MSKLKVSKAEKTVEAFFKSFFTSYLDLDFIRDFIDVIGGSEVFLDNIDNLMADFSIIDSLKSNWLDSSLIIFDNHKEICVDSAGYWEFNGDRLITIERLDSKKSVEMMLIAVNLKSKKLNPNNKTLFSESQVRKSLLTTIPHKHRVLIDKLVADYCIGCAIALSCWSFKSFLREG